MKFRRRKLSPLEMALADQELALRAALVQVRVAQGITRAQVAEAIGLSERKLRIFETRLDHSDFRLSFLRSYAYSVGAVYRFNVQPVTTEEP